MPLRSPVRSWCWHRRHRLRARVPPRRGPRRLLQRGAAQLPRVQGCVPPVQTVYVTVPVKRSNHGPWDSRTEAHSDSPVPARSMRCRMQTRTRYPMRTLRSRTASVTARARRRSSMTAERASVTRTTSCARAAPLSKAKLWGSDTGGSRWHAASQRVGVRAAKIW